MNKSKKILFVMPRLPFPATSGRKTSLYHYCRILSEELGYKLIVAAFLEKGDDSNLKPDFIDKLVILPKPTAVTKVKNIIVDSLLLKKKPMQVSLYWDLKVKKIIDNLVESEKPEIIIGDMVRSTEYIKDYNIMRIADLDDRISLRYQRQLEYDISGINPYGAFLSTMPKIIQKIMLWKPLKLYVVKNEIKLLKKYELDIAKQCDRTIFVAQQEADTLNNELGEKKAVAVPIGVDTDYFSYHWDKNLKNCIGFLGALSVAHNENAVRNFIENIFPFIRKCNSKVKFLVIGGGASEELLNLASENIIFTGRVDDVRKYFSQCDIFVCPMTFGSGIKTKLLEAMSFGLPVVTTSIGAENIGAEQDKDWVISDEPEKFAEKVCDILNNEEKRNKMSHSARNFVVNNWTWEAVRNSFEKVF